MSGEGPGKGQRDGAVIPAVVSDEQAYHEESRTLDEHDDSDPRARHEPDDSSALGAGAQKLVQFRAKKALRNSPDAAITPLGARAHRYMLTRVSPGDPRTVRGTRKRLCALGLCALAASGLLAACTSSNHGGSPSAGSGGSATTGAGGSAVASTGGAPAGQGGAVAPGAGGATGTGGATGVGGTTGVGGATGTGGARDAGVDGGGLPARSAILDAMRLANNYFMAKWPDPGLAIVTDKSRASNIWTRGVYYEGLMALYALDAQATLLQLRRRAGAPATPGGSTTARRPPAPTISARGRPTSISTRSTRKRCGMHDIKADIDLALTVTPPAAWSWIDAIQMAMPVYARLGVPDRQHRRTSTRCTRTTATRRTRTGGNGLYNKTDHLWWRDMDFDPPYVEPNGQRLLLVARQRVGVRGAGARARHLAGRRSAPRRISGRLPGHVRRAAGGAAERRFLERQPARSHALRRAKRLTGTALFTYGMAWGVRTGNLPAATVPARSR